MNEKLESLISEIKYRYYKTKEDIIFFFKGLTRTFSYYKILRNAVDYEYSSILEVEKYQMMRVRDSIKKYHTHLNWEKDVQRINLALKLLSIATEEDDIVEQVSGHFWTEGPDKNGLYELKSDAKYKTTKYVNIRNAQRFSKIPLDYYTDSNSKSLYLNMLRSEKAWYLYNKLRVYRLKEWWD